jgi:cytochrome c556
MGVAILPVALFVLAACGGEKETEIAVAPAAGTEAPAVTEEAAPVSEFAELLHERHENFETIGKNFKAIMDEMKAGTPASEKAVAAINTVYSVGDGIDTWFPEGSGPEAGKTEAKAIIWAQPEDFDEKITAFKAAVAGLKAAGDAGDGELISASFKTVGGTCKACHDTYREED